MNTTESPDDEFYELSTLELIFWCLLYAIIALLAIVGNLLVLFITIFRLNSKSITTYFILNLGLADLFTGIFAIPFKFQAALFQEWFLPRPLCRIVPYVETVALTVSVFTLVTSAVHEFRTTFFSKMPQMNMQSAKKCVILIWMMAIVVSLPHGLFHQTYEFHEPNLVIVQCLPVYPDADWWKIYNVYLTIIQYFVPMIILDTAYVMIAVKLWSNRKSDDSSNRRQIRMLIIVVACFSLCWFPLETYLLLNELKPQINAWKYINLAFFFSHWLAMSNSCLNPIIYGLYNEKYNTEYRNVFNQMCVLRRTRAVLVNTNKNKFPVERRWKTSVDCQNAQEVDVIVH